MALTKLKTLFGLIVVIYIISPVVFKYSTFIQRNLLFMNHVNTQFGFNLSQPEQIGLKCTRTLRLAGVDGSKDDQLGVWHILASSSLPFCSTNHQTNRTSIEDKLAFSSDSRPIVLYLHGNGGTRGGSHRAQLYRRLAYELDYHIVTFDYRGYGDSTYRQPTSGSLSADARFMYDWLLAQPDIAKDRLIVWGHSLGTAIAVRMLAETPEASRPRRLLLEAPFDSLANAIAHHPFSAPFRIIPYFEHFFVEPIESSPELNFDSAGQVHHLTRMPIMILHAKDDAIIPFKLGHNLYTEAAKALGEQQVEFVSVDGKHNLGHKHICQHDETMDTVRKFIDK